MVPVVFFFGDEVSEQSAAKRAENEDAVVIKAHPDEGEIYAGGTTGLFAELGHQVKFLSWTNGCCGHCLEKWYGSERSGLIEYAEAFELAPYNMATPTDEEWLELFPMLKR